MSTRRGEIWEGEVLKMCRLTEGEDTFWGLDMLRCEEAGVGGLRRGSRGSGNSEPRCMRRPPTIISKYPPLRPRAIHCTLHSYQKYNLVKEIHKFKYTNTNTQIQKYKNTTGNYRLEMSHIIINMNQMRALVDHFLYHRSIQNVLFLFWHLKGIE